MIINFDKEYLRELYENGKAKDKRFRFQPDIVTRYVKVITRMKAAHNVMELRLINSLRYEKLHGNKKGLSSVRVNDQYRIEFEEILNDGDTIAQICNISELSNHYK